MWVTCRVPQPGELGTDIEMSIPKPVCPTSPLLHQAPHAQPGRLSVAENNSQPFRQTSQVQHMQLPRLWADTGNFTRRPVLSLYWKTSGGLRPSSSETRIRHHPLGSGRVARRCCWQPSVSVHRASLTAWPVPPDALPCDPLVPRGPEGLQPPARHLALVEGLCDSHQHTIQLVCGRFEKWAGRSGSLLRRWFLSTSQQLFITTWTLLIGNPALLFLEAYTSALLASTHR